VPEPAYSGCAGCAIGGEDSSEGRVKRLVEFGFFVFATGDVALRKLYIEHGLST